MAKQQSWKIEAVLNNDIVGGNLGPGQDASLVRVFSEGLPAVASDAEIKRIRALGGENDSPSRELARYVADVGRSYSAGVKPMLIFRLDRFPARRRPLRFQSTGLYRGALHRIPRRFQPAASEYSHGKRHRLRRPGKICGLRICIARGTVERGNSGHAGFGSSTAGKRENSDQKPRQRFHFDVGSFAGSVSYEVVWRSTNAADWEYVQPVSGSARATLKVSKIMSYSVCARSMRRDIAVCQSRPSQKDKIKQVPRGQTISFSFPPFAGWVKRIIIACTAIYLIQAVMLRFAPDVVRLWQAQFVLIPSAVMHGKVWQLVTYSLLHVNFSHVFFNMLTLWFIGAYLESDWGPRRFIECYTFCVVGAALVTIAVCYSHFLGMDPGTPTAGASGGIFGLLMAFGILYADQEMYMFPLPFRIKGQIPGRHLGRCSYHRGI